MASVGAPHAFAAHGDHLGILAVYGGDGIGHDLEAEPGPLARVHGFDGPLEGGDIGPGQGGQHDSGRTRFDPGVAPQRRWGEAGKRLGDGPRPRLQGSQDADTGRPQVQSRIRNHGNPHKLVIPSPGGTRAVPMYY